MNKIDRNAYSAMLTAELTIACTAGNPPANESALRKIYTGSLSRQVKSGSLDKKSYRYLVRILMPKETGFLTRWKSYLNRYQQITSVEKVLASKSDLERLEIALNSINEQYKTLIKFDIEDQQTFEGEEQNAVAQHGFIGLTASQRDFIDEDGHFTDLVYLSAYAPSHELGNRFMSQLQLHGFSLYAPDTQIKRQAVGHIALIGKRMESKKAA